MTLQHFPSYHIDFLLESELVSSCFAESLSANPRLLEQRCHVNIAVQFFILSSFVFIFFLMFFFKFSYLKLFKLPSESTKTWLAFCNINIGDIFLFLSKAAQVIF